MLDIASKFSAIVSAIFSYLSYKNKVSGAGSYRKEEGEIKVYIEHQWPAGRFADVEDHVLEVQVVSCCGEPIPLRRISWCVGREERTCAMAFKGGKYREFLLATREGLVLYPDLTRMIPDDFNFLGGNVRQGYYMVKSLRIKIDLVGRSPCYVSATPSLMLLALQVQFRNSMFFNWYQFRLLNT